jgi:hypothetical protein
MKSKLKALLAAALITVPVLALDAAQAPAPSDPSQAQMSGTRTLRDCCYVYFMGRWYCIPC